MMTFSGLQIQIFILALIGCICLITVLLTCLIEYQSHERKRSLILIESATAVLVIADILEKVYRVDTSTFGLWIARISNFLMFFLVYAEILAFNKYIHTFVKVHEKEEGKLEKTINMLSYIGIALIIISQFTGMYYSIGENNEYIRGPLFAISFLVPLIILIMMLGDIIRKKEHYSWHILLSAILFAVLPLVCSLMQAFLSDLSLFNISIGVSTLVLFGLALVDQNEYLRRAARTDRMTKLPNAYGLLLELDRKIYASVVTEYSALYFDIVRMGLINRKFGNAAGDYVILEFTKRIQDYLVENEVLGRLGGNYFVSIVRKDRVQEFLKLISGVDIIVHTPGGDEKVTVSAVAGVYDIDDDKLSSNQIMTNVSMAVNIAKNIKKKPYVYLTKDLMQEMNEQRQLQEMIPACMAKKEFMPYYQPKVNIATGELCGAEALARWIHDGEIVPPFRFIPTMEINESICKLDFYMLHAVCEDIKSWLAQGITPPTISVNFSRKNLGNPILAEAIYNVVKSYDIPLNLVQIEITETVDEYPLDYLKGVVEALHRYGLSAAIDDFGTGSSSIKILKEVPFDVLKIDKSFIDSITEKDKHILAHIIGMADEMNARVITEGVETKEQVNVLKELGCEEIQGYFFDKPMEKAMFEERMANPVYEM